MKGRNWKDWFKKAGIRAAHTVAQSAVACIGTAAVVESVDWNMSCQHHCLLAYYLS